jgi:hypothetical protein
MSDPSAIKEDAMVDLNRKLQAHQPFLSYRLAIAMALVSFQSASMGLAQEPRKPSWMPFPMGRASSNYKCKQHPVESSQRSESTAAMVDVGRSLGTEFSATWRLLFSSHDGIA